MRSYWREGSARIQGDAGPANGDRKAGGSRRGEVHVSERTPTVLIDSSQLSPYRSRGTRRVCDGLLSRSTMARNRTIHYPAY